MSDEIRKQSEDRVQALVKDIKDRAPMLAKIKQMAKLAGEIGEPVPELEAMVETAEAFSNMVLKRFDKTAKKE